MQKEQAERGVYTVMAAIGATALMYYTIAQTNGGALVNATAALWIGYANYVMTRQFGFPLFLFRKKFFRDLASGSERQQRNAWDGLSGAINRQQSIETLDALQTDLEGSVSRYKNMRARVMAGNLLSDIAQRKATLTREKDGEMLAGETVRPAARKHSMFHLTRRVAHG